MAGSNEERRAGSSRSSGAVGGDDLRHSLLRSRIDKLPHLPAIAPQAMASIGRQQGVSDGFGDEELDSLGPMGVMPPPASTAGSSRSQRTTVRALQTEDLYSPRSASDCFEEALEIDIGSPHDVSSIRNMPLDAAAPGIPQVEKEQKSDATFRAYYTAPKKRKKKEARTASASTGLHSIELPDVAEDEENQGDHEGQTGEGSAGTVFLFHHGAGYSALSFALVAKHITRATQGQVGVLAYDCRGHGNTRHSSQDAARELSLEMLTQDALDVLSELFPLGGPQPTLILVGHSMGGSVVVSLAHALLDKIGNAQEKQVARPRVAGVAILDVVEGTAMAALPSMKTIVQALPLGFNSIEDAIRWHVDSGTIVNLDSAKRSVPSLLRESAGCEASPSSRPLQEQQEPIEELQTNDQSVSPPQDDQQAKFAYIWRHNLLATEPYWRGWFEGLSQRFLTCKCARLLLLAGTDRLDKDLMIGQMQGKFQMNVFADVGHSLQEDAPQRTADLLVQFWRRNEAVNVDAVKGLRKVGQ